MILWFNGRIKCLDIKPALIADFAKLHTRIGGAAAGLVPNRMALPGDNHIVAGLGCRL